MVVSSETPTIPKKVEKIEAPESEEANEDFKDVERPDYFLLTAWNYKDEIITKVRNKGNKDSAFIVPFPTLHII